MKRPVTLEPFHIVRARRIRRARLYRLALGLALGGLIFAGLGGLAGCAALFLLPETLAIIGGQT